MSHYYNYSSSLADYNEYASSNYTLSSSPPTDSAVWDEVASRPRTTATANNITSNPPTCGIVILPNGTSLFVQDKEAYFAANPAARASTAASFRDFTTWADYHERRNNEIDRAKAAKRSNKIKDEEDAGLHGCVKGKKVEGCGACGGNGCAGGISKLSEWEGQCDECEGKGFVMSDCDVCVERKQKGKGKREQCPGGPVGGSY